MAAWQVASVVGLVVGIPALVWVLADLRRIPAALWARSPYSRPLWATVAILGYLVGGWPAVVVALAWRFSRDRADLVADSLLLARADGAAERE
jgi:hypothetical protein